VAEATARRRLGDSIGLAESNFIVNGTGSSQPLGILQSLLNFGDIAANRYTLNSESRAAAVGTVSRCSTSAGSRRRAWS
jgi:HK97 family phage major capsid protein